MSLAGWAAWIAAGAIGAASVTSTPVFSFDDSRISESSGLVDLGDLMVTTNDSGDEARVFVVDSKTGRTVATTSFGAQVDDVEALAPAGDSAVWVGDIGDNRTRRDSVRVFRVPVGTGDQSVRAESFELVYPDGAHDAESMVYGPDSRLRIISKSLLGGRVYVAPKNLDPDRPNRLVAGPRVDFYATDAALFPDAEHVLVRGYGGALILTFPGFKEVAQFGLPDQEQGEGVSIGAKGRIRISSEGVRSEVLQVRLPADVVKSMATSGKPARTPGLDADGVVDSREANGLVEWPWLVAVGSLGVLLGWVLLRRRR